MTSWLLGSYKACADKGNKCGCAETPLGAQWHNTKKKHLQYFEKKYDSRTLYLEKLSFDFNIKEKYYQEHLNLEQ